MYSQWKIEHTTETDYFLKIHENNLHNEEMQWEVWRLSHYLFSYEYFYSVALWNVSHPPVSLSTTHIQALDIQCTLWSPKYTPNDILDISKNYHLLLRYLYLPYTLHWYFFFGHAVIKNTWRFSEIFIQIICFSFLSFPL